MATMIIWTCSMNLVATGEAYEDLVDFGFGDEVDESCDDDDNIVI